jgi:hypothetical protein
LLTFTSSARELAEGLEEATTALEQVDARRLDAEVRARKRRDAA